MLKFTKLNGKVRTSAKTYAWEDMPTAMTKGQIGLMIPKDMVILDVDSEDERAKYYIEWLINKFKGIFITKTNKAGQLPAYTLSKYRANRLSKDKTATRCLFDQSLEVLPLLREMLLGS